MIRSPLAHDFVLSPNIEPRRNGRRPDMIVLHYTGMESASAACAWLCNSGSGVSCHYLIDEEGRITQMVGEEMRAWHAGLSSWEGDSDTNSRSIGIEIHNPGHTLGYPDFPRVQMQAVAELCRDIAARHAITPARILAHSDVAPARKIDPGEKFDWGWLASQGIGHWVEPSPPHGGIDTTNTHPPLELQRLLKSYGYGIEETGEYDPQTRQIVTAFQRHFRPARVDGIADSGTLDTLNRLVAACIKLPP